MTAVYWIFNQSFVSFKLGYGAALSMVLLVILVAISLVQLGCCATRRASTDGAGSEAARAASGAQARRACDRHDRVALLFLAPIVWTVLSTFKPAHGGAPAAAAALADDRLLASRTTRTLDTFGAGLWLPCAATASIVVGR